MATADSAAAAGTSAAGDRSGRRPEAQTTRCRPAGADHSVLTVEGGTGAYRRTPCGGCPWKVANAGSFPPEAFEHSAETAYDIAEHLFACHESGAARPAVCAGFLLRGAQHNLAVRLGAATGRFALDEVDDGGHELFEDYRAMAVGNGVEAAAPALERCR